MQKKLRTRGHAGSNGTTEETTEGTTFERAMRKAGGSQPPAQKKEINELAIKKGNCLHCGKEVFGGYYGIFGDGGVCSKTCNQAQEKKPKYPPSQKMERLAA
jgi:hypothetical protein